jgi:hypothetical protein
LFTAWMLPRMNENQKMTGGEYKRIMNIKLLI